MHTARHAGDKRLFDAAIAQLGNRDDLDEAIREILEGQVVLREASCSKRTMALRAGARRWAAAFPGTVDGNRA